MTQVQGLGAPSSTSPSQPVQQRQVDPVLQEAAEGMEALFLDYLTQAMRKTVPESDLSLSSPAVKLYQSMLDSEVAKISARSGGVGLAEQIVESLDPKGYTNNRNVSGTGGAR